MLMLIGCLPALRGTRGCHASSAHSSTQMSSRVESSRVFCLTKDCYRSRSPNHSPSPHRQFGIPSHATGVQARPLTARSSTPCPISQCDRRRHRKTRRRRAEQSHCGTLRESSPRRAPQCRSRKPAAQPDPFGAHVTRHASVAAPESPPFASLCTVCAVAACSAGLLR